MASGRWKYRTHRDSQVAPGPSREVFPGGLVWMNVASSSSIFSRSMTSLSGSCFVNARILAPKRAMTWSEMSSTEDDWK